MSGTGSRQNGVVKKFALIEAVKNHDVEEVKRLIDEGADVNEADGQGNTPLLCAIESNVDLDIIKALVENGAKILAKDRYERSSLFYAVTKSTETASYLFEKEEYFNHSDFFSILSFFINSLCTKRHDSHPTFDEVLPLLKAKGLTPEVLAKSIVSISLCKLPLLLTSGFDGHPPRRNSQHPMFHLHGKRTYFLDLLKKVSECKFLDNYQRKESLKEVLKMIEDKKSTSSILDLLKKHGADPSFADSDGNTALHYAACLPWMGVPEETVKEVCDKLQSIGVPLNKKNHQDETPLLFCLSGSIAHLEGDDKSTAMKTLVKVCEFLVSRRLVDTSKNEELVFHLVIKLFQQGFEIREEKVRKEVIDEIMNILHMLSRQNVGNVAQKQDDDLNSPLHLWASLVLKAPLQDYNGLVSQKHTFEKLLGVILGHLVKCGALKNARNKKEETPLHLCNTWSAVKLLIHIGANPNDKDSSKRPSLLAAASRKTFLRNPSKEEKHRFYPDVQGKAKPFFKAAIEKKLDPWAVDKDDKSILGFFLEFEIYDLSKALIKVACRSEEKAAKSQKIFVSLLKAICKDESLHTFWKIQLVKRVLLRAKEKKINVANEPFGVCCETISRLSGKADDKPPPSDNETVAESDGMDDNGSPSNNETNRESERKKDSEIENTLHCEIAIMLRSHGAKLSGESYETLKTKSKWYHIDQILENTKPQPLIPWTSRSKNHRDVLYKVARYQECQEIESVCYHQHPAAGFFGSDVFVGINKQNGKEVAIKCFNETECTQELKELYADLDCEHVIRCLPHTDNGVVYIVFKLMEGNLNDYFNDAAFDPDKGSSLCEDVVKGLHYLHENDISRHFQDHLKPTSIFYATHPKLCLKITGFGHYSQPGTPTDVWLSPEVLTDPTKRSNLSDMFSCGLLLHYILSKGKHPFWPADCTNKSESDIVSETEANIKGNNNIKIQNCLSPEAIHLAERMLQNDSSTRLTARKALDHPLFWSKKKKMDLIRSVADQREFGLSRTTRTPPLTAVENDLETKFCTIVKYVVWNDPGYVHMPAIYANMTGRKGRLYDTSSVVELVRFIRNAYAHVTELPKSIQHQLLEGFVFLDYFPNLVMEVYKAVTSHGWDQTREEIKYEMRP